MGKKQDFSPQEIRFIIKHIEEGWSDKDISEEIQGMEYPPRPARTIGKLRKIYEAVYEPVKERCREDIKRELAERITEQDRYALDKVKESIEDGSFFLEI